MTRRILSKFLAFALIFASIMPQAGYVPSHAEETKFTDMNGHWAKSYVEKAVQKGIVNGFADGSFKPDDSVTRAQFIAMVNRALGNNAAESISFKDVDSAEWYYQDVRKAVAAAYVSGYDTGDFKPGNSITRAEAAVIISRIVPTYGQSKDLSSFEDSSSVDSWAKDALTKVAGKGYIGDYGDGKIHPKDVLTRAQAAKIIGDIVDKETIVTSETTVSTSGTELSNKIYSNGVTVSSGIGNGSASLSNVVILGQLRVNGGSSSSGVTLRNSRVASANVAKSSDTVRFEMAGDTSVPKLTTSGSAIIVSDNLSSGAGGAANIDIASSADTSLRGSFKTVNTVGSGAKMNLDSGQIETVNVEGKNSEITVSSKGSVGIANANAACKFLGTGTIGALYVNASGVTYETKPKSVVTKSGISVNEASSAGTADDWIYSQDPEVKESGVYTDSVITITFEDELSLASGKTASSSNLSKLISLNKKTKSGSSVSFTAKMSTSKSRSVLTITPDNELSEDTRYYVTIEKGAFEDGDGNTNAEISYYFDTGDGTAAGVYSTSPTSGKTGVSITSDIVITFDEVMSLVSGSVKYSNIKGDVRISTSKSGSTISYTPDLTTKTVSSKKRSVLTLDPSSSLSYGTTYYVTIDAGVFENDNGDENSKIQFSFTTVEQVTTPTLTINSVTSASNATTATMSAKSSASGTLYAVVQKADGATPSKANIKAGKDGNNSSVASGFKASGSISTSNKSFSFSGLTVGQKYTVYAYVVSSASSSYESTVKSMSFTAGAGDTVTDKAKLSALTATVAAKEASFNKAFDADSLEYSLNVPVGETAVRVVLKAQGASGTIIYGGLFNDATGAANAKAGTTTGLSDISSSPELSFEFDGENPKKAVFIIKKSSDADSDTTKQSKYIITLNKVAADTSADLSVSEIQVVGRDAKAVKTGDSAFSYDFGEYSGEMNIALMVTLNDANAAVMDAGSVGWNNSGNTYTSSFDISYEGGSIGFTVYDKNDNTKTKSYTLSYSLSKPTPTLSADPTSLTLTAGEMGSIDISYDGEGSLSAESGDTGVATVSLSGKTLTVTAVAAGECKLSISAGGGSESRTSVEVSVKVNAAS